jgi:hypothetical protein
MVRLGTFGFTDMKDMVQTLCNSGLGALELFSMGLKVRGLQHRVRPFTSMIVVPSQRLHRLWLALNPTKVHA